MSYLIDTNVISELKRPQPNAQVVKWFSTIPDEKIYVSVLSLGEIRKGIEKLSDSPRKIALCHWLENELITWFGERLLPVDAGVADTWGRLQAELNRPLPAIDSLLAATALHYNFYLVTRNTKDFVFPKLEVINPWEEI
ncbi:MAG: hypothetical protein RL368_1451 [Pseudomonadota bacterium]|jgi:predicted nucleic acid-binding protein